MKELDRKRILVTGGAGFLGSHLCERLVEAGHDVLCVDNFFTGTRENVAHLIPRSNFELMRHDITFPLYVEVDEIYNLACPASPVHYQYDPVRTTKTSVHGAINMLGLAKRVRAKIFQASTSEVYGDARVHPQKEDYWGHVNPIGPRSCYDEGKRCAETLFADYRRQYGLEVRIARIFNTYGPRMHPADGRVISNFMVQALSGDALTVYGDGAQTRSLCYVDDMIDAFMRLMDAPDGSCNPVNLGNPHEITMIELARRVLDATDASDGTDATDAEERIAFRPLPIDDPWHRQPDISAARALLGWEPTTSLDEGLRKTAAYFRERLDAAGAGGSHAYTLRALRARA
ncbi:UDP-glucuronic acid decarboxylase family protein [Trinickia caryophylli]|uniref:UDP-glucuronate decarboxylase n=1 Tax=Trinickia caryophylli TaxID=28094 RepID=A0A1X7EBD4_TRICW|nr:UDP-glucuronic acid decarboxylase family protein [Trinickia caryophylli]PMS12945.1 SDR family NAD-dependent epimerase/dehydratase [Trinickia caryophylli]TRX14705.1 SDR family oxidoreductase [Trinickia caryophylli]WQE14549.1 UDP-glucuronic acid decarboxylase family protein [Trinickia caryophylli]SMF31017.1 UDP-glucuronate decarboxylase [Trinickia caryophylli]GLU32042.1 NAD-dependent dehydratase [Trinickia caryophylli]